VTDRPVAELRFPAMGTEAHVIIVGSNGDLVHVAQRRLAELERRWSRFVADSDVNRINSGAGRPVAVCPDTFLLVTRAVEAWRMTGGAFDPTVLASMHAIGYDRTFTEMTGLAPIGNLQPSVGCVGIVLDARLRTVMVPIGVGLDLGGIGKGLAADLVVAEMIGFGAGGACVNIGGDVRVDGLSPTGDGWELAIADPFDDRRFLTTVRISSGALVTSSTKMRAWVQGGRRVHHLINPLTGGPSESDLVSVSVLTADAWSGEALAKAMIIVGIETAQQLAAVSGVTGVLVADGEGHFRLPGLDQFTPVAAAS
jgi:FAD:protein FMN transferase